MKINDMINMELHEIEKFIEYIEKKLKELKSVNAPEQLYNGVAAIKLDLQFERKKLLNGR